MFPYKIKNIPYLFTINFKKCKNSKQRSHIKKAEKVQETNIMDIAIFKPMKKYSRK